MKNSNRSPKNKLRVAITFRKPILGIGSSWSFTSESMPTFDHPSMKHAKSLATKNKTTFSAQVFENKKTFPEFEWKEIAKL